MSKNSPRNQAQFTAGNANQVLKNVLQEQNTFINGPGTLYS